MRLLLELVLCWLILQHVTVADPTFEPAQTIKGSDDSKQYIQWAVTVEGDCQELSQLPSALTKALLRDVQTFLRAARQDPTTADTYKSVRAVLPDERFQPSCDRVKSRIPGDAHSAYVAIRIAVILQHQAGPSARKLDSSLQSNILSQLNKGWRRCSAAFPARVFTNIATTLKEAGVSAVVNRASRQPVSKRTTISLRELQPCVHSSSPAVPRPSPPPWGPPPGTSPPAGSPDVNTSPGSPSPSPEPQQVTCASIICAPGTLLKPNASNIIPTKSTSTQLADSSNSESAQNICCDPDCSLVPGSVLESSGCICSSSSSNSVKLLNNGIVTACLPVGTTCGAGAAAGYPVTARPELGVGPAEACLTLNSTCPASLPVSFFRASAAGGAAQLLECGSAVSEYDGCKNFWGFQRRVEKQDGTLVGCLSEDLGTAKCPEEYGFGFAYWDADMKVLLCRPSSQQDCPYIGSLDNVQIWNAENKLIGCALIPAEGRCPDDYPVFAKYSLDPPNNHLVQCRAANTGCPSSELYTRNFPFFLVEGTTLQGCLAPQTGFTTCSKYHAWNGVPVFGGPNHPSGCIARTASSCWPPNYLPYYDTSRFPPLLVQCHPPLQGQGTCQSRSSPLTTSSIW